jgi:hypothetical protein
VAHRRRGLLALTAASVAAVVWVGSFLTLDWWEQRFSELVPLVLACLAVALGTAALILGALGWRNPLSWLAVAIVGSVVGLSIHELLTAEVS